MPYPRFTKAIIHHFMSQHKSISKREGSQYHTVTDDGLLERLKFINKGDLYQVYGKPIPYTWITDEINKSKAYQMYFKYFCLIPPKKRRGRAVKEETNKDKNEYDDEDDVNEEEDDEEESVNEEENVDEENKEEYDDDDDDDKSFNITNTDNERMESDSDDHEMSKEGEIVADIKEEETANSKHKEDDTKGEDQKTKEGVPDLVTNKEKSEFLQSTSSHSISSNFDVPMVQNERFHEVKVSVIPESTQQPPSTPPLPATKDLTTPIINFKAVDSFLNKFHALGKDVKELKQVDHFATILELVNSYLLDEDLFESYGLTVSLKRNREEDKYEDPSTGPNQGKETKKRRSGKEAESSKKSLTFKESTKEPTFQNVANDAEVPHVDLKPRIPKLDWFTQPPRPETPEPHWNTVKIIDDAPEQPWFNEKPPLTFDEVMSKSIDFKAYAMNQYNVEECFGALINHLDLTTPEGYDHAVDMSKPLPLQEKEGRLIIQIFFNNDLEYLKGDKAERTYSSSITKTLAASVQVENKFGYGYLKEIVMKRADQQLYKFIEGDFLDLHLNDIEDMLLLLTQNRLFNLYRDVIVQLGVALSMFTRGIVLQSRVEDVQLGVESYQRKLNLIRP
nr:hypothetical protein [Tanacetum cinerariifolium]